MKLSEQEENRMEELEGKQNLTEIEAIELQSLLDRYYDQRIEAPSSRSHDLDSPGYSHAAGYPE